MSTTAREVRRQALRHCPSPCPFAVQMPPPLWATPAPVPCGACPSSAKLRPHVWCLDGLRADECSHGPPETTVIELAGPDRAGKLAEVTRLLVNNGCDVRSAAVRTSNPTPALPAFGAVIMFSMHGAWVAHASVHPATGSQLLCMGCLGHWAVLSVMTG